MQSPFFLSLSYNWRPIRRLINEWRLIIKIYLTRILNVRQKWSLIKSNSLYNYMLIANKNDRFNIQITDVMVNRHQHWTIWIVFNINFKRHFFFLLFNDYSVAVVRCYYYILFVLPLLINCHCHIFIMNLEYLWKIE